MMVQYASLTFIAAQKNLSYEVASIAVPHTHTRAFRESVSQTPSSPFISLSLSLSYFPSLPLLGHGADVKCVDWHPRKDLLVSGSKDNQQPVKLWDPKAGQSLTTLLVHLLRWSYAYLL